ncbi:sensor histidine kinase [Derxia gummosa]|uniref:histidine kinase n=1 Tax=Derxia gummosa DSM 723 TaxID=1121388 RepID=A0A8B6X9E9_9BURK|nr:ATP-binding protein [Derxia gummosa]
MTGHRPFDDARPAIPPAGGAGGPLPAGAASPVGARPGLDFGADRLALAEEAAAARLLEVVLAREPLGAMLERLHALLLEAGCARCMLVVFRDGERPARIAGSGDGEGLWSGLHLRDVALALDGVTEALRRWLSHEEVLTVRGEAAGGARHATLLSFDVAPGADPGAAYAFAARLLRTLALYLRTGYEQDESLRQRLAEAELLREEIDSFNQAISHDLRAPVRRIRGLARLVADEGATLPAPAQAQLRQIDDQCEQALEMCSGLLALSRGLAVPLAREPVDLGRLGREVCARLTAAEPQREGRFTVRGDVIAPADPALMKVLLENLLGNAWKFTRGRDFAEIELGSRPQGEGIAYYVRDNGVGFDLDKSDKLFRAFSRLHDENEFPGTGIGLATVNRIVRRHGGRLWAEARPGQGATFLFTLGGAQEGSR